MQWDTANIKWIMIPSDVAEKHRTSAEKARIRRARYEHTHPKRDRGGSGTPRPGLDQRKFIVWDGEGPKDTGYSLFGNSEGMEICKPGLHTLECFELLIDTELEYPDCVHLWFGGNYDASMILCDLSWRHLASLHRTGRTVWRDWEIEHIPHKWMKVKHGKIVVKIFDIRSFFSGGLVSTLEEWKIGPWQHSSDAHMDTGTQKATNVPSITALQTMNESEIVRLFKSLRAEFLWADIEQIRVYMRLELKYSVQLMERLREIFYDAGYTPSSWHGPGALARMALKRHNVYDAMVETPVDVRIAAQYAFIGGRFEQFTAGIIDGPVYCADIHSAYPYYATFLPNLSKGKWRHGKDYEPCKFAVYYISYKSTPDAYRCYPLPRRLKNGNVVWPYRTEGWYWAPEAALVADDSEARFIEAWVFDEDDEKDRPFAFLQEYYRRRQLLKRLGNPAEWVFKLIINSIYGQLAQRAGWNEQTHSAPRSHQLEWAGYITSACRASVYRTAKQCGDNLISIDTDGVCSRKPFTGLAISDELGDWEVTRYDGGVFWQSGIYALKTGDEWVKAKTRGIPKGTYSAEQLIASYHKGEPLKLTKKVFIGYGLALTYGKDKVNSWESEPHEFEFGGTGKRMHIGKTCKRNCEAPVHRLAMLQALYGPEDSPVSARHYLPWLDTADEDVAKSKLNLDDYVMYDANHLDIDDDWVIGWTE